MRQIRGNEISMVFQEPMTSLNPVFTCGYQVEEAVVLHQRLAKREAARAHARDARHGEDPAIRRASRSRTRTSSRAACASA